MDAIDEFTQFADSMRQASALLADEHVDENSSSSRRPSTFLNVVALGNTVPMKKENGQTVMIPLFQSQENIVGKISIEPVQGKKVEHNGIKIELLGQIEIYFDRGNFYCFTSIVKYQVRLDDGAMVATTPEGSLISCER